MNSLPLTLKRAHCLGDPWARCCQRRLVSVGCAAAAVESNAPIRTAFSPASGRIRQAAADRDLVLDVLSATATRREAKSYLSRFGSANAPSRLSEALKTREAEGTGVSLGNPIRSVDSSPIFRQTTSPAPFVDRATLPIHAAIVIIRWVERIDDTTLQGVGHTLSQLSRLGLSCIVVIDHEEGRELDNNLDRRRHVLDQVERVASAIEKNGDQEARRLESILSVATQDDHIVSSAKSQRNVQVVHRKLLHKPLSRGLIPVVAPIGYGVGTERAVLLDANEVALALAADLAGLTPLPPEEVPGGRERISIGTMRRQKEVLLDRIIVLDPRGGIPAVKIGGSHVFINLEQEYQEIRAELSTLKQSDKHAISTVSGPACPSHHSLEAGALTTASILSNSAIRGHLSNLQLARETLSILPPSSSALITTPIAAAQSSRLHATTTSLGVGTRTHPNPLIHNLLTDKPVFSSSLPRSRLGSTTTSVDPLVTSRAHLPPTHLKHGLPLTIIPDPRSHPWTPPTATNPPVSLSDPRIDLSRLVHLIQDSFGRTLDVQRYLDRIGPRLAGIIIAGAYEGGAILTWESPSISTSSSAINPATLCNNLVPYLDKFAVLKRAQGAGGVADIVFSAVVQECFPNGVCWRSRRDNPVNKWYFERARGTWKLPLDAAEQGWTMFWTTDGLSGERWREYEAVCRRVESSWKDGVKSLD